MKKATLFNRFVCVIVLVYMAMFEKSVKSVARGILFRGYWWQFVGFALNGAVAEIWDYIEWYDAVDNFGFLYRPQWQPLTNEPDDIVKWEIFVDDHTV